MRSGEPLNRVVVVVDGDEYELHDLPGGGVLRGGFVFRRNRNHRHVTTAAAGGVARNRMLSAAPVSPGRSRKP
ncbi:hypothetical protein [Dactylosporangium fulvum]|uniref:Uncharacterized protein n=1 Tax=Dactylosporangium fulvum TaxID=53359 RepID=A0ABY5VML4_9ACTN|nr:hypothetical protein [Dactylosporangium fulvum]UWP78932.1 hypothetical protein Dfulv_27600 [Dactylosporangium fulvum]